MSRTPTKIPLQLGSTEPAPTRAGLNYQHVSDSGGDNGKGKGTAGATRGSQYGPVSPLRLFPFKDTRPRFYEFSYEPHLPTLNVCTARR